MIPVSTARRLHECSQLGSAFVARADPFGPHFFDPQIPQEFTCVTCGSLSQDMSHMNSWDQGVQVFCLFRTWARWFLVFLAPWFGHEKAGILETQYDLHKTRKHAKRMKLFPRLDLSVYTPTSFFCNTLTLRSPLNWLMLCYLCFTPSTAIGPPL